MFLSGSFYLFCINLVRLQQEIDSVLEGRPFVEYEDLSRLEYVGQVFKETLRLYPVASGTSRHVKDEVNIDGFRIPANSDVMVRRLYIPLFFSLVLCITGN